jgi:hypothetical protein
MLHPNRCKSKITESIFARVNFYETERKSESDTPKPIKESETSRLSEDFLTFPQTAVSDKTMTLSS